MTAPLDIVTAMTSPALFAPWYPGESWNGWRTVLKAAHCLPLDAEELAFFKEVAGGRDPPRRPVKELWAICGRGAGKDSIASLIVAHAAALFDPSSLRPGERAIASCLACDRDQAKIVLNYTRSFFTDCAPLKTLVTNETASGFELSNRVDVQIQTNSHRSVRGRSILCCVMDETAFWRDETSAIPDEEVYRAVGPGLARVPGSMLIGISSPYKKSGLLYRKWDKHFGKNDDDVLVIQAGSRTLNPTLDQADIDRRVADDPVGSRAEWYSEWRDDVAGWLPLEMIEAAVDKNVSVRPPLTEQRVHYVAAFDPSGGAHDSYTAAVAHREKDGSVVLDCIVEVKPPFNPSTATERIVAAVREYGLHHGVGDRYAANWVVSAFQKCAFRYEHSERDRSQIYLDVMPLFTSGRARILDNQRLITQFASLERRTSALGKDRVDHGRGGHDDLCNAAALAMVLADQRKGFRIPDGVLRASARPYYSSQPRAVFRP